MTTPNPYDILLKGGHDDQPLPSNYMPSLAEPLAVLEPSLADDLRELTADWRLVLPADWFTGSVPYDAGGVVAHIPERQREDPEMRATYDRLAKALGKDALARHIVCSVERHEIDSMNRGDGSRIFHQDDGLDFDAEGYPIQLIMLGDPAETPEHSAWLRANYAKLDASTPTL